MRVCRLFPGVVAAALVLQLSAAASQAPVDLVPCTFPAAEITWLQRALDGWEQVSRESLRIDPAPLPWIVLFDASCVWHVSPDASPGPDARPVTTALSFAAVPNPGARALSQGHVPAAERCADVGRDEGEHVALSQQPRRILRHGDAVGLADERGERADARRILQGVFSHEMTHTRLLVGINRRVRELARKNELVYPITDDVIQAEFQRTNGFEAAFNRERDQFYRAALEPDPARQRELTIKALEWSAPPRPFLHRADGAVCRAREPLSHVGGSRAVGRVPAERGHAPAGSTSRRSGSSATTAGPGRRTKAWRSFCWSTPWSQLAVAHLRRDAASPFALLEEAVGAWR